MQIIFRNPLNDYELVSYFLSDLGSEYDSFVTSVTTRVDPMTLDDLYGHLLAHELKLEQNQPAVDLALASANIAARKDHHEGVVVVSLNNFSHLVEEITSTTIATEIPVVGGVVVVQTLFLELLTPSVKFTSNLDMKHWAVIMSRFEVNLNMKHWAVIIDLTTPIKGIRIKTCKPILLHLNP